MDDVEWQKIQAVVEVAVNRGNGEAVDEGEWKKTQAVLKAARQVRQVKDSGAVAQRLWDAVDVLSHCLDALDNATQREAWCLTINTQNIPQWIGRYDTYEAMETAARTRRDHSPGQWVSESGGIVHWRNREAGVTILGDLAKYHGLDHPCRRRYVRGEAMEVVGETQ